MKLIIFGNGMIAQLANFYFSTDTDYEVVAFTVDLAYCNEATYENKPIVAFEEIEMLYPPSQHEMFIAISYAQMNKLRMQKFIAAKDKGFKMASYISSKCNYLSLNKPGENAFILEDNTIQPFVKIEENVTLWSGNHIGHHSTIAAHNFISSHVVVSGNCKIDSFCFFGVNSALAHNIEIAKGTLIGAGAIVTHNTVENSVYVAEKSRKLNKTSDMIQL